MEQRNPELRDFGVTQREHDLYKGLAVEPSGFLFLCVALFLVISVTLSGYFINGSWLWGLYAIIPGFLFTGIIAYGISNLIQPIFSRWERHRLLQGEIPYRIQEYEQALSEYWKAMDVAHEQRREDQRQRWEAERRQYAIQQKRKREQQKQEQYWKDLNGLEFEQELATLCRAMGYRVEMTPRTGDQGIDLVLRNKHKITVVQCKAYARPVGPSVVRELYGSMKAYKADSAVLACPGGFTKGVIDFAKDQDEKITLLDAPELARLAQRFHKRGTTNG